MDTTLLYVATDGSYGDATDLLIVNSHAFIPEDWESLDNVDDRYRQEEAAEIGVYRSTEPLTWVWMTEREVSEARTALEFAIDVLNMHGNAKRADSLTSVLSILERTGIKAA